MLFLQFPVTHTVISHLNDNKETENQLQKQIVSQLRSELLLLYCTKFYIMTKNFYDVHYH